MLNLTRLWCGLATPGDSLRYGEPSARGGHLGHSNVHRRPVVVWNITRRCNLHCLHCYIAATSLQDPQELDTAVALRVVDQLADYEVPVLLLSGGEPLARPDLMEIASHAAAKGLKPGLSTNGTMLTPVTLSRLQESGVGYIGVSLDGPEQVHDRFRGSQGAYRHTLAGIRGALAGGFRLSLRFTLTRYNYPYLHGIFDLVEREGIPRLCVYHLAYAGRGARVSDRAALSHEETRQAVDLCLERAEALHAKGLNTEVLTVDNHADAVYVALKLMEERPEQAGNELRLLLRNGGNASGVGIGAIGPRGDVHADQFSHHRSFGNVRDRSFGAIWEDTSHPVMAGLKARPRPLAARCASCPALALCNGNLRVRAEAATGDPWAPDPACYLTEAELARVGEAIGDL